MGEDADYFAVGLEDVEEFKGFLDDSKLTNCKSGKCVPFRGRRNRRS